MTKKIIISPQIVVYKNILKNSNSIIDLLESADDNDSNPKWKDWYENGWRSSANLNRLDSNKSIEIEKICDAFDYICKDYMEEFSKEKGKWPDFIKDWDSINLNQSNYQIDFFRYNNLKFKNMDWKSDLLMDYHVDEFSVEGVNKKEKNIVTVNFYLNDNYSGGEICAYDDDLKISYRYKPEVGDAVVMPSSAPFFHAVKPFYLADRYFLRMLLTYEDNLINGQAEPNDFYSEKHHVAHLNEKEFIDKNLQFLKVGVKEVEVLGDI